MEFKSLFGANFFKKFIKLKIFSFRTIKNQQKKKLKHLFAIYRKICLDQISYSQNILMNSIRVIFIKYSQILLMYFFSLINKTFLLSV